MKVGVLTSFNAATSPDFIEGAGSVLDQSGLHCVWLPEHILFFEDYAEHYPNFGGSKLAAMRAGLIDPFAALTFLAAVTSRIRLGTAVCLVPQRNPVYTAKHVADLDFLSGGRFDFGVGVGWLRKESVAVAQSWQDRGARTTEALTLMKSLWCDDVSHHDGEHYQLPGSLMYPKPIQKPHPPLYIGGHSEAALRRTAALGDGWIGFNLGPESLQRKLHHLQALLLENDRSLDDIQIVVAPEGLQADASKAQQFSDLGVDQLVVLLHARTVETMKREADRIGHLLPGSSSSP